MKKENILADLRSSNEYKKWVNEREVVDTLQDNYGAIMVVVEVSPNKYNVYFFFKIGLSDNWQCSIETHKGGFFLVLAAIKKRFGLEEKVAV